MVCSAVLDTFMSIAYFKYLMLLIRQPVIEIAGGKQLRHQPTLWILLFNFSSGLNKKRYAIMG